MFEPNVDELKEARQLAARLQKDVDVSHDEWRAANEDKIARADQAKARAKVVEDNLRGLIVMSYAYTANKKPHPKLGVRVSEVPTYDPVAAISFALTTAPKLLMLDKKAFESYAKGVRDSVPLFFVCWEEKVTAIIAKNLEE